MRNFPATGPSEDGAITVAQVKFFRVMVTEGQRLRCKIFKEDNGPSARPVGQQEVDDICILQRKFPFTADTSKGSLQWTMLTIWNRELLKKFEENRRSRLLRIKGSQKEVV